MDNLSCSPINSNLKMRNYRGKVLLFQFEQPVQLCPFIVSLVFQLASFMREDYSNKMDLF